MRAKISFWKNKTQKIHIAKNGQKGIWVSIAFFSIFIQKKAFILFLIEFFSSIFCFILAKVINIIQIILQLRYDIISAWKLKLVQAIIHIKIQILKSQPHIQFHPDTSICKKKKINTQNNQIKALQIAVSSRFMLKINLIVQIIATITNRAIIS